MSDSIITPSSYPELAAQQVILELVKSGAVSGIGNEGQGQHAIRGLIAMHEQLTAYYRTLNGDK